ncbi:YesL family protein [Niallia sp. FSL M8-0099]|uniref:YesL family protein n=1 Tax=Niallia sp. FSL M8-0099 TaxID=2954519 RepID=UPI0030F707FF
MSSLFQIDGLIGRKLARMVDIFLLNLIFILFSLPVVTIGASLTALYTVSFKIINGEDPSVWRSYIKAFKKNLKQSSFVWFLLIGIAVILFGDIYYLVYTSGIWKIIFMSLTLFFGFLYSTLILYIFPYLSRFEDSIKTGMVNSLLMGGFHFPFLVLLLIINYLPIIFIISSFTGFMTGIYFFTFGGFSIFALLNTFILKRIFSKYENKKGEK